ncbi:RNA polymerase sigma factor [Sutcliffiella deserti]|uniref:RNA polymerase sigma factor n=1 Tax=Sutcliffiella deserti TaxID=2875501 RepID=UPI001CBDF1F8|nr:sigma-70 family RNA polymerase sigma factor [Sutcliffiella deserti]
MNVVRLVKKAKKGSKEALLQLIMAKQDDYYRLALTYLGDSHDAMDAMEDMIVILYEKIDQLKKEEAFYSWSKTILVNSCKDQLRKRKKIVLLDNMETDYKTRSPQTIARDDYIDSERQIDIQQVLLQLNEHQREAIQLKYFHDFDYQTIAQITKVSVGTVKSRVFQGLKKLREFCGGEKDE